jgi:hypothetical protein
MSGQTPVRTLDVRPMLAAGEEPFDAILGAAREVPAGGVLEVVAPFEPAPLYAVLGGLGFSHRTDPREGGAFAVRFTQTGITATSTVAEVAQRSPAAAGVFARHLMDLCCGGSLSLERAAKAHGVELPKLLAELREAAAA